jgi:hypothetical protein
MFAHRRFKADALRMRHAAGRRHESRPGLFTGWLLRAWVWRFGGSAASLPCPDVPLHKPKHESMNPGAGAAGQTSGAIREADDDDDDDADGWDWQS